tara:strand:+ start:575 stop:769 length:195 start_codon:yes stop_codon:yes gene_type:complete
MRYNVLFIHPEFWLGTTIDADDEEKAVDIATNRMKELETHTTPATGGIPSYIVDYAQEILVEEV